MPGLSVLRVVSNSELAKQEQEDIARELEERQNAPMLLGMSAYLKKCWEAARFAKNDIEKIMLKAMRQRNGEYEPEKLEAIRGQGGSEVFMMITEVKCRAAESWLRDILLDTGAAPWNIDPTPIPDVAPEQDEEIRAVMEDLMMKVMETQGRAMSPAEQDQAKELVAQEFRFSLLREAQARADGMKDKIADQFSQGGWAEAFNDMVTDLVTYPAAIVKGPIVRRQRTLGWEQGEDGKTVAKPIERIAPEYERVDPFRFFPEPGITTIDDGYCFEHHPLTRTMLSDLLGVPGYDEQAIRALLDMGPSNSWINILSESQKQDEERKFHADMRPTDMYDALEFWGKISGKMLLEWGLTEEEVPDPTTEYDANVWMIGDYVIKAVLNYDPLGKKPYAKTSFIKCPGAFWGKGIPEIIEDLQGVCNAAARGLVNNMGIASGPQVEVNLERIPPNEDITQIFPWKIWQGKNGGITEGPLLKHFTLQMV
mgnify:CR=1 FL=1